MQEERITDSSDLTDFFLIPETNFKYFHEFLKNKMLTKLVLKNVNKQLKKWNAGSPKWIEYVLIG